MKLNTKEGYIEEIMTKILYDIYKANIKMAEFSSFSLVIILNINGLSAIMKRQRLPEWLGKNIIQLHATYKRLILDPKPQIRLKVKVWKKLFQGVSKQKRTGVTILISNKIDSKSPITPHHSVNIYGFPNRIL